MSSIPITISYQGKINIINILSSWTVSEICTSILDACQLINNNDQNSQSSSSSSFIKILYKGKQLNHNDRDTILFSKTNDDDDGTIISPSSSSSLTNKKKIKNPKFIVMSSNQAIINDIQNKRSDPTIRGFDQEDKRNNNNGGGGSSSSGTINNNFWGSVLDNGGGGGGGGQDCNSYRFIKIKACNEQDFGHAIVDSTPHAFMAQQLLEQMANDPGIVSILKERKLVVNTLYEMDPIDDRLMQKKQHGGSALLGYNTNRGLSIHVRLRTFDLKGFFPYEQLIRTLIHELSHNWVGDHNLLFWGNFAQMRLEYLHTHARLSAQGIIIRGKTSASWAGVTRQCQNGMQGIAEAVIRELSMELPQYGLSPQPLIPAIQDRCNELTQQFSGIEQGQRLGGSTATESVTHGQRPTVNDARRAAWEAAERRAKEANQRNNGHGNNNNINNNNNKKG